MALRKERRILRPIGLFPEGERMEEEEQTLYKYRLSICKANGSVWMEEFDNITSILEEIKGLLLKHPHLVVSRQKVVERNER